MAKPWTTVGLLCAGFCLSCGKAEKPAQITPELHAEAVKLYDQRCASCHGPQGKGDGPEAAKLALRPRNFSDPTWQLAVPDRLLQKAILEGGAAVGKSPVMPAHPDLGERPDLLAALLQHLRILAAGEQ